MQKIRIIYYPFTNHINDYETNILTFDDYNQNQKSFMNFIGKKFTKHEEYDEYGIHDIFVKKTGSEYMYYRKKTLCMHLDKLSTNKMTNIKNTLLKGVIIIEILTPCDEIDFPYITQYPHMEKINIDKYTIKLNSSIIDLSRIDNNNNIMFSIVKENILVNIPVNIPENIVIDHDSNLITIECDKFINDLEVLDKKFDNVFGK